MKREIYVLLKGRIGNQLFIYSFAHDLQKKLGDETQIIMDDSEVLSMNWENSLEYYDLQNVRYVHDGSVRKSKAWILKWILLRIALRFTAHSDFNIKIYREKRLRPLLNFFGIMLCENGYMDFHFGKKHKYLLCGYFQSKKYFESANNELRKTFSLKNELISYPNIDLLRNSNSVCISVKVEHNVGSSLYAVCGKEYWKEAIDYIISKVPNPLFFVCSDNVEYVKENLIDCSKFKVVFQDKSIPVHITLAAMGQCKHFIIGNTSYGWWAQYLSDNPNKIVVAPNQWMLVDIPIDIYESHWHLIDVKKYLGDKAL